ncbi:Peptidoglycan deacetylase [Thauera sp. GDN1]|uniref:XrtA system polysaccharide deacetylase n=1 Tax=Thauera sp. GDN1 TaxID=2944810 RepID=UPI0024788659|nr:XrtA system polysaccharide deacetylase [Thauera sp. GDN1]WEN41424.1 Peptidoglycan deacetylase [Thauera sp. GDN1]
METRITNAFTCDVEDYFQVSALAPHFPRNQWDSVPCRVEANVERVLELLDGHGVRGTFFTLGWIAERFPQLVRRVADAGHEVASHGYGHQRASELTPEAFRADIRLAKAILEDITGRAVTGYRAPSFSIGTANLWAHDCIAEEGYRYSSSVYPVRHDHYGIPDAPRFPWRLPSGLVEVPITTLHLFGRNWPAGGGGFFRLLPYALSRWQIAHFNTRDKRPAIFYFHPWELDPDQPRVTDATTKIRFRHYINLSRTAARLDRLLSDFSWGRADEVFSDAA